MKAHNGMLAVIATGAIAFGVQTAFGQIPDEKPSAAQIEAAVQAGKKVRGRVSFWRSDELGLVFGYDERWSLANPSQRSTQAAINWRAQQSGGLMATCYLESISSSGLAKLKPEQVGARGRELVESVLRNSRARDPQTRLVTWRAATQDNVPVVYLERDMRLQNLNDSYSVRVYSIITSWNGQEVNFECASEVPLRMPELAVTVEAPIQRVLGSLQFVREPQ